MDARMKTPDASNSCRPPSRPWVAGLAGNAGDRIQISSGTVAMRLIVMELGRFMGLEVRRRAIARAAVCATESRPRVRERRMAGNKHGQTLAILPQPERGGC